MPATPIEIGPFTGGVNLADPAPKLSPDELAECRNWRLGVRGNFYKRPGHDSYGSSPAKITGDNLVNLLVRYYRSDGSKLLLGAAGGKFKKGTDATGAWTAIDIDGNAGNSMSASNLADYMVYKDRIYITDGIRPHRYNGTDDLYVGHFIHAAPTLAQPSAGSIPNGTYKYFVTSVAGNMGEGPKGAEASITVAGGPKQVDISVMAAAAAKYEEVSKRIYRTKIGGSLFYLLAEIPSATTTFTDNTLDSALVSEYVPVSAPPSDARFVILGHDERTYWLGRAGVNASLVTVSDVGFSDRIIDANSIVSVANNDGDILTGGGLTPGGMVFFKKNSAWLQRAFGTGLINLASKQKRGSGYGTTSPFSIVTTPIGLIFLSQLGQFYKFDGTNMENIGYKVEPEFKAMPQSAMEKVMACYHDFRYIISYDYRGQRGYNWKTLEYNTLTNRWEGPHENVDFFTPSYYAVYDSVLDKGELAWGEAKAAAGSYAYIRGEFSKTDRGNKFLSRGKSGALALAKLGEVLTYKAFVQGDFSSDVKLSFSHVDDSKVETKVELNIAIAVTAGKYNVSKYNSGAKYGGVTTQVLEGPLAGTRARLPQYIIDDGGIATEARINIITVLVDALALK